MPVPSLNPIRKADSLMLGLWQSGRELFHSNTLAYLIADAHYGPCLLEKLTGDSGWTNYDVRTLREKWQLDIVVIARKKPGPPPSPNQEPCAGNAEQVKTAFEDWRIVVIENKFKSLPDRGQLMRYTKKLDDRFRQNLPGNEGCNGQRDAGAKLLCELWRADFPDKTDDPAESQPAETDEAHGDEIPTEEHTDQAKKSGKTSTNRQRVEGTLYRVILQPTLAKSPRTPCSSKPCTGCAAAIADCVEIAVPNTSGTTPVRHWRAVSYQDLMGCLPRVPASPTPKLSDLFIPAYRDLVDATCDLHANHRTYLSGPNPFADVDQLRISAQTRGIWDFIDKWRYGWLAEEMKLNIQRSYSPPPGQTLPFKHGQVQLPDHPGRVTLFSGTNNLKCWIIASSGYSRGTGMASLDLVYYLDAPFTAGKYIITLQLQGGSLKLMLGYPHPIPSWASVAPLRLGQLSDQLLPCLPAHFAPVNGSPKLRSYGGGQKVYQLAAPNQLTQQPGSILYWSAQMWPGNPPAGHWAINDMDHIAGCLACSARSILQYLDGVAISSGTPNRDWF